MNTDNNFDAPTENELDYDVEHKSRELVVKYLEQLDRKFVKNDSTKRFIHPMMDLNDYIEDSMSDFLDLSIIDNGKNFAYLVILTITMFLGQLVLKKYPPEELMTNLIDKELNSTFCYESNTYFSDIIANYIITADLYKKFIIKVNEKLEEIILNDKNVFFDYFMMISSSVQNYLLDEKNPEIDQCENEILSFFNQKKKKLIT